MVSLALTALAFPLLAAEPPPPQQAFFDNLKALCGQSFQAQVSQSDPGDKAWRDASIVVQVRDCSDTQLKLPLHVGADRSRVWVLTKTASGLELKHDHRHQDGSEDKLSQYGGHTREPGSAGQQDFPADDFSKALFLAQGLEAATANVWTLTLAPGKRLGYALNRPGRAFAMSFDLEKPVATPPPAWDQSSEY